MLFAPFFHVGFQTLGFAYGLARLGRHSKSIRSLEPMKIETGHALELLDRDLESFKAPTKHDLQIAGLHQILLRYDEGLCLQLWPSRRAAAARGRPVQRCNHLEEGHRDPDAARLLHRIIL